MNGIDFVFGELVPYNNSGFSRVEVSVAYEGLNRNGSIITSEAIQTIVSSLPGSPIVGFWKEESGDFDGHNGDYSFDENSQDFKFVSSTVPYGFVTQEKPQIKNIEGVNYVVAEALLWTKRFPNVEKILHEKNNQSMELDESTMQFVYAIDGTPIITHAEISALCILGEEVEPCFEEANFKKEGYLEFMKNFQLALEKEEETEMPTELLETEVVVADVEETEEVAQPIETETEVEDVKIEETPEVEAEDVEPEVAPEAAEPEVEVEAEPEIDLSEIVFELESAKAELAELREFKAMVERNEKASVLADPMFANVPTAFKEALEEKLDSMSKSEIEGALALEVVRGGYSLTNTSSEETIVTSISANTVEEPAWIKAARKHNKN